ncbi:hypothetical protein GUJ93_ZPchr0013g36722 [Zizania palustris]|uniref:Uncharacterized protein n=1 Tax=Zizania palustris TaxID=103762 RepID=A0A8J5X4C1_ZIZPA|nr:hypothetical protein GUJ93_ZPchr0013g36722 [Zizania palustris]
MAGYPGAERSRVVIRATTHPCSHHRECLFARGHMQKTRRCVVPYTGLTGEFVNHNTWASIIQPRSSTAHQHVRHPVPENHAGD